MENINLNYNLSDNKDILDDSDIINDIVNKHIYLYNKNVIIKSFYYGSEKILINFIEDFNIYSTNIIENDLENLIMFLNIDSKKKLRSLLIKCIQFNSIKCFKILLKENINKISINTINNLSKLCCFLERDIFLTEIKNNTTFSLESITELILYCVNNGLINQIKKFNKKLINKKVLEKGINKYITINYDDENYINYRNTIVYLLEILDEINPIVYLKLINCTDDYLLNSLVLKHHNCLSEEIILKTKGYKIYDYIKVFSIKYSYDTSNIFNFDNEKDKLILDLLIEEKFTVLKVGIDDNIFNLEDIKKIVLKNDLVQYCTTFNIQDIDCLEYDSFLCFNKSFNKKNLEVISKLIIKYNSIKCFSRVKDYTEIINLTDFYYNSLISSSFDFFKYVYDHFNKPLFGKNLLEEVEINDWYEKTKLLGLLENLNIINILNNNKLSIEYKENIILKIQDKYLFIIDSNKNTFSHICCKEGITTLNKINNYYNENNEGFIPIELLRRKIEETKKFNRLKKLIKIYDNNLQIVSKRI